MKWIALYPLPPVVVLAVLCMFRLGGDTAVGISAIVFSFTLYYGVALAAVWWLRVHVLARVGMATIAPFVLAVTLFPVKMGRGGFFGPVPATVYLGLPGLYIAEGLRGGWNPPRVRELRLGDGSPSEGRATAKPAPDGCEPVTCALACPRGFASGPDGCLVCRCAP